MKPTRERELTILHDTDAFFFINQFCLESCCESLNRIWSRISPTESFAELFEGSQLLGLVLKAENTFANHIICTVSFEREDEKLTTEKGYFNTDLTFLSCGSLENMREHKFFFPPDFACKSKRKLQVLNDMHTVWGPSSIYIYITGGGVKCLKDRKLLNSRGNVSKREKKSKCFFPPWNYLNGGIELFRFVFLQMKWGGSMGEIDITRLKIYKKDG